MSTVLVTGARHLGLAVALQAVLSKEVYTVVDDAEYETLTGPLTVPDRVLHCSVVYDECPDIEPEVLLPPDTGPQRNGKKGKPRRWPRR